MFASSFVASDVAMTFRTASVSNKRVQSVSATAKMSRIGKLAVQVPDKVKVTINGNTISVKVRTTSLPFIDVSEPHFVNYKVLTGCMWLNVLEMLVNRGDPRAALALCNMV